MTTTDDAPVTLRALTPDDDEVIDRLWQLYWHDLSQSRGSLPNASGRFKRAHLDHYLADPVDYPGFLVLYGTAPAGFAFVTGASRSLRTIGEFFVVRAVRRRGVGEFVARTLIERYPGPWEIAFQDNNPGAPEFWKRVVAGIVGDAWREEWRPVPDKPHIAPDHWLLFRIPEADRRTP